MTAFAKPHHAEPQRPSRWPLGRVLDFVIAFSLVFFLG